MNEDVMELSNQQFEAIVEEVTKRLRPVVQSTAQSAGASPGGETGNLPMVLLPPEFYQSQREISDRVARLEERFVQFDTRFEQVQSTMDKRFEAMDKRFEEMQSSMDKRFEEMQHQMDKRFEAVDKRFEAVDRRFEGLDRRFNGLVALVSLCATIVGGLVVLVQVL
jgi:DNA anti-recombination protein RmuC